MTRHIRTASLAVAALCIALGGASALAQDDDDITGNLAGPNPAHIHSGSCPAPGDVVVPLSDVVVPVGTALGTGTAAIIGTSVTEVPMGLTDILAAAHAINVHRSSADMGTYIACGDITGVLTGTADLAIRLGEQNNSDREGVAWLHDIGDGTTTVSIALGSDDDDDSVDDDTDDDTDDDDGDDGDDGDDDDSDDGDDDPDDDSD